jgi:hypothetical protein
MADRERNTLHLAQITTDGFHALPSLPEPKRFCRKPWPLGNAERTAIASIRFARDDGGLNFRRRQGFFDACRHAVETAVTQCPHSATIAKVTPSAKGCEECLETGDWWVHLRLCRTCGHVGCCDDSPNRHATAHFHATTHPIIEGYDPPEGWGWCFVDEEQIDLPNQTPQIGPIPRFF